MKIQSFLVKLAWILVFINMSFGYVARTKNGFVRGIKRVSNKNTMYTYFGIPYAQPPIGDLRFKPPQPSAKWKSVRDATGQQPQCVQSRSTLVRTDKIEGSEDCLYLNVYTPRPPNPKNNSSFPVMVWIHGGGFFEGDNSYELYPPDNFVHEGIVVVTISYRLNIFGFLSTNDLVCPGNNGLKDQIMALAWVKENIESFGGDPDNITVWGESAGGISVSHLMSSPKTSGLYNKAILQSGGSIMSVSIGVDQPEFAFKTGELLGIVTNSTEELVLNLKSVDYRELQAAASRASVMVTMERPLQRYPFATVIEPEHADAVIVKSPYVVLENKETQHIPVLMGFNSNEGDGLPDTFTRLALIASNLNPASLVPVGLNLKTEVDAYEVGTIIKEYFFKNDTTMFSEENFVHWYGSTHIIRPAIEQGQLLSSFVDVFFYRFNCIGILGNPLRTNWAGVGHAEELNYLFPRHTRPKILPEDDTLCSKRLVKMWANFVKYGNPSVENDELLGDIVWPKTAPVPDMKYLDIGKNLTVEVNPDEEDFKFWKCLFDTYGNKPFTVY